ncbi:GntR family transcriptional regulator, partial [Variovorax sp. LT2P21]|uniref:GntR family transcriptional regulator n=1 Tax=Variovorax sp. LT2P21 TaxID=3443731 RepID=UPI003F460661
MSSLPQAKVVVARAPIAPKRSEPKAPSLTQRAYDQIKNSILSMELRPGLFLNEAALCEMTGLGRMPVHQAIHKLQADGLIEVIPRKGLVIRSDSLQDILLLIEARLAIEPNIVALAAQRIHNDQIAELRRLLKQSASLVHQRQRESFSAIDRAFHGVVADAAFDLLPDARADGSAHARQNGGADSGAGERTARQRQRRVVESAADLE